MGESSENFQLKNLFGKKTLILVVALVAAIAAVGIYFRLSAGSGQKGPYFVVENYTVAPENLEVGEEVSVRLTVTNEEGAGGQYNATLYVDNQQEDTRSVQIGSNETSEIAFTFSKTSPDNYRVGVNDLEERRVRFYVVEPLGPKNPLTWVSWYLEMPESNNENAPTKLEISVSASSGLNMGLYRVEGTGLELIENEWWTEGEVDDRELTVPIGRGSLENQVVALIVEGPSGDPLYKRCKEYQRGRAKVRTMSLYRASEDREYAYALRKIKGRVEDDLPIFVDGVELYIDNEPVKASLSEDKYVVKEYFPAVQIYPELEEGTHRIKVSFLDESGGEICSYEENKVFG